MDIIAMKFSTNATAQHRERELGSYAEKVSNKSKQTWLAGLTHSQCSTETDFLLFRPIPELKYPRHGSMGSVGKQYFGRNKHISAETCCFGQPPKQGKSDRYCFARNVRPNTACRGSQTHGKGCTSTWKHPGMAQFHGKSLLMKASNVRVLICLCRNVADSAHLRRFPC